jgi:hypothetical protein
MSDYITLFLEQLLQESFEEQLQAFKRIQKDVLENMEVTILNRKEELSKLENVRDQINDMK